MKFFGPFAIGPLVWLFRVSLGGWGSHGGDVRTEAGLGWSFEVVNYFL